MGFIGLLVCLCDFVFGFGCCLACLVCFVACFVLAFSLTCLYFDCWFFAYAFGSLERGEFGCLMFVFVICGFGCFACCRLCFEICWLFFGWELLLLFIILCLWLIILFGYWFVF